MTYALMASSCQVWEDLRWKPEDNPERCEESILKTLNTVACEKGPQKDVWIMIALGEATLRLNGNIRCELADKILFQWSPYVARIEVVGYVMDIEDDILSMREQGQIEVIAECDHVFWIDKSKLKIERKWAPSFLKSQ